MSGKQKIQDGAADAEGKTVVPDTKPADSEKVKEIGGRKGPDPTRYGDWEKNGRCVDF